MATNQNLRAAAAWYRKAALGGSARGANNLGKLFFDGRGVSQVTRGPLHPEPAGLPLSSSPWFAEQACLPSKPPPPLSLAPFFLTSSCSRCVWKDPSKAVAWFKYATKCKGEQCPAAFNNLGICFEDGLGAPQDATAAESCYQKAADQGHLGAMLNLAYLQFDRSCSSAHQGALPSCLLGSTEP